MDPSYPWELCKPASSRSFCFLICQMGTHNSACLLSRTAGFDKMRCLGLGLGSWASPAMGRLKTTGHPSGGSAFSTGLGRGVSGGITFYLPPEPGAPVLHGELPTCLPPLIWKQQQQKGLHLSEAPADTPATAARARVVQHTWGCKPGSPT